MKYDVKISCLGHTFNVTGIEANNKEEAEAKALKAVKSSAKVASSSVSKPSMKEAEELFNKIFNKNIFK